MYTVTMPADLFASCEAVKAIQDRAGKLRRQGYKAPRGSEENIKYLGAAQQLDSLAFALVDGLSQAWRSQLAVEVPDGNCNNAEAAYP